jgi:hypothetical protein
MRFFEPDLRLGVLLPPQAALEDKFGGLPWGLPVTRWPLCAGCGQPQSLLAQLRHHRERLDLGRDGRVLHVFQCADWANTGCSPFEWGRGRSACFVLEPGELRSGLTPPPGAIGDASDEWAWHGHTSARVAARVVKEEAVPAEWRATYFDARRWGEGWEEVEDAISMGTKLGGMLMPRS